MLIFLFASSSKIENIAVLSCPCPEITFLIAKLKILFHMCHNLAMFRLEQIEKLTGILENLCFSKLKRQL